MRETSIIKIFDTLQEDYDVDLSNKNVLDFFAREGDWQTMHIHDRVSSIDAWEIDEKFERRLKQNLPNAHVSIGDSFKLSKKCNKKFDIILIDNPQYRFGLNLEYCEHFEALSTCLKMLKKTGIIIFNVKTKPFDYNNKVDWQQKRNNFYGVDDASNLSKDFVVEFYKKYFKMHNYETKLSILVERPQEDGLYAYACGVTIENN